MNAAISLSFRLMALFAALVLISACAVTTGSTEGTSETFQNTSDASTDLTSSTSPRSDSKKDEGKEEAMEFTRANFERVKIDMAVGGGEHLASLATLLGVSHSHQEEFFSLTKENFSNLYSSDETTAEELLAKLDSELSANPRLRD